MFKWIIRNNIRGEDLNTVWETPRERVNRRMDVTVAIDFLQGYRFDTVSNMLVEESMYVTGVGFVELVRYLEYLEDRAAK